jgi:hypothetical protein
VRGWGHPLDSWPGCLPVESQYALVAQARDRGMALTVVAKPLRRGAHLCAVVSVAYPQVTLFHIARGCAMQESLLGAPFRDSDSRQRPTAAPTSASGPGGLTSIVSNVSALEARTTREGRHDSRFFRLFCSRRKYTRSVAERSHSGGSGRRAMEGCFQRLRSQTGACAGRLESACK